MLRDYESGCRHGAPSRDACRSSLQLAAQVEAVQKLVEAYASERCTDGPSLLALVRRWCVAVHPDGLLIAQAMAIDALADGGAERSADHADVARVLAAALDAGGSTEGFFGRVAGAAFVGGARGDGAAVAALLRATCTGVPCGCLGGGARLRYRRPWEEARAAAVDGFGAGAYAEAARNFDAAAAGVVADLADPVGAEDGRNGGLVGWALEARGVARANASVCYLKSGDVRAAVAAAEEAAAVAPAVAKCWARLGAARSAAGDPAAAAVAFGRARDRDAAAGAPKRAAFYGRLRGEHLLAASRRFPADDEAAPAPLSPLLRCVLAGDALLDAIDDLDALAPVSASLRRACRRDARRRAVAAARLRAGPFAAIYAESGTFDAALAAPLDAGALLDACPAHGGDAVAFFAGCRAAAPAGIAASLRVGRGTARNPFSFRRLARFPRIPGTGRLEGSP